MTSGCIYVINGGTEMKSGSIHFLQEIVQRINRDNRKFTAFATKI